MHHPPQPLHVLQGAQRHVAPNTPAPTLLIAGATGVLGNEVLRRLVGSARYGQVQVLAREPVRTGIARVALTVCPGDDPTAWPTQRADVAVVMFEPPRMFYERERALWVPSPTTLLALSAWLKRCGVRSVAVVMPHTRGHMPLALQQGFANLDEQAVSALGFERLVWVRSAQKPPPSARPSRGMERLRDLVLSVFSYMVPQSQQPLRVAHVAHAVSLALQHAPAGVHVVGHEQMWHASRSNMAQAASAWFS
ncbi:hypothetical protein RQP54_11605 [Curvibacter sp. APW13]|uniref:hypothetical protein n=1 Tax=Curvibacter sp. APW13 TaxID=3077236 RepID=UPI0028DF1328|nr:hypothetical protein [Curvibacter sp. APW13]MDT8991506.1 hypothetical protein [Curvibacter sp. APW13]